MTSKLCMRQRVQGWKKKRKQLPLQKQRLLVPLSWAAEVESTPQRWTSVPTGQVLVVLPLLAVLLPCLTPLPGHKAVVAAQGHQSVVVVRVVRRCLLWALLPLLPLVPQVHVQETTTLLVLYGHGVVVVMVV